MDQLRTIEIRDRLYLREQAFVCIWDCEQEIRQIAHGEVMLTSPQRTRNRQKGSTPRTMPAKQRPPTIRRLITGEEDAFRVWVDIQGVRESSVTDTPEVIRQLFQLPTGCCDVVQVETVTMDGDGNESVVATLYTQPPSDG